MDWFFSFVFTYSTVLAPPSQGTVTLVRPLSVEAGTTISTYSRKLQAFIGVYKKEQFITVAIVLKHLSMLSKENKLKYSFPL